MPKEFYTEKDIEDLVKRGIFSLEVNDNVVLTDLAYEKAHRLGLRLVRDRPDNPPSAPVRPYLSQKTSGGVGFPTHQPSGISPTHQLSVDLPTHPSQDDSPTAPAFPQPSEGDLRQRIRDAVIARLGSQVDAKLLDVIITRVLQSTGAG